ncbi:MAG: FtsX-like permease family protein [Verrucomicrobiales bacterium]|nr:FtsX-like permease family protein [Verrucomicrobiales bacterium]MCP5524915.1 FtsX-like permease family protein [Verrucomicrobiales bacterium]
MKFASLIVANLLRRKLRTGLTLVSVTVAFILYAYLSAIRVGLSQGVDVAGADRMLVWHAVSLAQPLPLSYLDRIKRIPGVDLVVHQSWFGGIYQNPRNFFAQMPVDPEPFLRMYPEFLLPEAQKQAWLRTRTGAIAGRATAERFGWKVGDRIPLQTGIWTKQDGSMTWEFDLVGIFDGAKQGTDTTPFYFRYDYFDETRRIGKGLVGWYVVRVTDPDLAPQVARAINEEFANSSAEVKAESEKAFLQGWAKQVGDIGTILTAILTAVFFTILLVAGNTMAQSVRERTEELGVLKAVGFTHEQVLGLVLVESCLLSGLGAAVGLGIGRVLTAAGDPTGGALPVFFFPPRDMVLGAGLGVLLGLASGALPAWQAMRLRVADALRRG